MKADHITLELRRYMPKKPLDFVLYGIFTLAILKLCSLYFSVNPDDSNWK